MQHRLKQKRLVCQFIVCGGVVWNHIDTFQTMHNDHCSHSPCKNKYIGTRNIAYTHIHYISIVKPHPVLLDFICSSVDIYSSKMFHILSLWTACHVDNPSLVSAKVLEHRAASLSKLPGTPGAAMLQPVAKVHHCSLNCMHWCEQE